MKPILQRILSASSAGSTKSAEEWKCITASLIGLRPRQYATATLHRPSNVDDPVVLAGLIDAFSQISRDTPVVFPVHPRTRAKLPQSAAGAKGGLRPVDPLGYLDFLKLMASSRFVFHEKGFGLIAWPKAA